jgi:hypothetical protein
MMEKDRQNLAHGIGRRSHNMKKIKIFAQEGEFEVTDERSDSVSYKGGGGHHRSLSKADENVTWKFLPETKSMDLNIHAPIFGVPDLQGDVIVTEPSLADLV